MNNIFSIEGVYQVLVKSLNDIIGFLVLVATVAFLWGIIKYIAAGGDEDKVSEARNFIRWGIIFLAVMIAVWGFVYVVIDFFFGSQIIPSIPGENIVKPI